MPNILNLKFKGNKSFVAFSNLNDTESLTKTWKVCTKVASFLEQGQRLENLSWRLWHLQNLMVDTDNARSKREFKKLSKTMGDKLDKEKGRSIEDLIAPDFKRNTSTDMIQQRAEEKQRSREEASHGGQGIKRMQFTFSVDQPAGPPTGGHVTKPDLKPSAEFSRNRAPRQPRSHHHHHHHPPHQDLMQQKNDGTTTTTTFPTLHFPSLFSDDFGPSALLHPTPTSTNPINYGEGLSQHSSAASNDSFNILRPTIELPLDDLLSNSESPPESQDIIMHNSIHHHHPHQHHQRHSYESSYESDNEESSDGDLSNTSTSKPGSIHPLSQQQHSHGASTPVSRPRLSVKTEMGPPLSTARPGAALVSNSNMTPTNQSSAPGGVKAECVNCGATHTPLWRRGLNDELNCNACGLYCKLHKRPRPRSMRAAHGAGRPQSTPRPETMDIMAQCYNCHTTATPLWRKDDEGKTVCNACGLYFKLHGSARPISMKSDVLRKRSRPGARRATDGDTPSASPGVSRRASPSREDQLSPTFAPDSTTTTNNNAHMGYDNSQDYSSNSELMSALGSEGQQYQQNNNPFTTMQFPGPYNPDYMHQLGYFPQQQQQQQQESHPFSNEFDGGLKSPRAGKRRRMSVDSASEPPSSAGSYHSYDSYSSSSSSASHSHHSSIGDFPFSSSASMYQQQMYGGNNNNNFWHPPMTLQQDTNAIHPPMIPPSEYYQQYAQMEKAQQQSQPQSNNNSSSQSQQNNNNNNGNNNTDTLMDFLHTPMYHSQDDDSMFNAYLHPPMVLPEDSWSSNDNSNDNNGGNGSRNHEDGQSLQYAGNGQHDYDGSMRIY